MIDVSSALQAVPTLHKFLGVKVPKNKKALNLDQVFCTDGAVWATDGYRSVIVLGTLPYVYAPYEARFNYPSINLPLGVNQRVVLAERSSDPNNILCTPHWNDPKDSLFTYILGQLCNRMDAPDQGYVSMLVNAAHMSYALGELAESVQEGDERNIGLSFVGGITSILCLHTTRMMLSLPVINSTMGLWEGSFVQVARGNPQDAIRAFGCGVFQRQSLHVQAPYRVYSRLYLDIDFLWEMVEVIHESLPDGRGEFILQVPVSKDGLPKMPLLADHKIVNGSGWVSQILMPLDPSTDDSGKCVWDGQIYRPIV